MTDKLDEDIRLWAFEEVRLMHRSGYSGTNAVERILRDPGISSQLSQHRVLWWPRSRRIAKISKASHQLTPMERICLIVNAGAILDDDGKVLEVKKFCKICKGKESRFGAHVNRAKRKLREILRK